MPRECLPNLCYHGVLMIVFRGTASSIKTEHILADHSLSPLQLAAPMPSPKTVYGQRPNEYHLIDGSESPEDVPLGRRSGGGGRQKRGRAKTIDCMLVWCSLERKMLREVRTQKWCRRR